MSLKNLVLGQDYSAALLAICFTFFARGFGTAFNGVPTNSLNTILIVPDAFSSSVMSLSLWSCSVMSHDDRLVRESPRFFLDRGCNRRYLSRSPDRSFRSVPEETVPAIEDYLLQH